MLHYPHLPGEETRLPGFPFLQPAVGEPGRDPSSPDLTPPLSTSTLFSEAI